MMKHLCRVFFLVILLILGSYSIGYAQGNDLSALSCAVLPEQILGQAHTGYAGAAHTGYAGAFGEEIRNSNLEIIPADIISTLQYAQAGSDRVAIIIVDDFSSDMPVENSDWATASHGWLVKLVFDRMVAELPASTADLIQFENLDLASVVEFRSDTLASKLEALINSINASQGITKFVVNMSFVFVACEQGGFSHAAWRQRLKNDPNLSLVEETGGDVDYVEELLRNPKVERIKENGLDIGNKGQGGPPEYVQQKLQFLKLFEVANMNSDPLRKFFMKKSSFTIIPVASSGNFKWKRPFFPAQWPEVLSVSATQGTTSDLWSLSNNAEISAPGAYFYFDDEVYRAGTSFAAPVVSLMSAIDLTNASARCTLARNGQPELGSNGQWNDVPLLDAVRDRC